MVEKALDSVKHAPPSAGSQRSVAVFVHRVDVGPSRYENLDHVDVAVGCGGVYCCKSDIVGRLDVGPASDQRADHLRVAPCGRSPQRCGACARIARLQVRAGPDQRAHDAHVVVHCCCAERREGSAAC
jgi:hypothetical protein